MHFADVASAIRETVDEAQAKAILAGLREGVAVARFAVNNLTASTVGEVFLNTPIGQLIRWASPEYAEQLVSDQKKAALKAIDDTNGLIDKLASEWWNGAATGVSAPDGTATWTEWKRKAAVIADSLQDYVQYQVGGSMLTNLPRLVADLIIRTVNCLTDPASCVPPVSAWPWYLWAGAGAIGLFTGAYLVNTFAPRRKQ